MRIFKKSLIVSFIILLILAIIEFFRPIPVIEPISYSVIPPKTEAISVPLPDYGQSAIGAPGYGVLASHNDTKPVSIASIAKVITALAIIKEKPIPTGTQGPTITLDSTDVEYYNYYSSNDGSVAKVTLGEQLSEYEALETMLLPSANNMADSLARWAFGSLDAYTTYANKMVKDIGLTNTTVGGASGFADNTTSTASDLVKLGEAALKDPTVAAVVSQSKATVPVAGDVQNLNWLLGQDGVVGIKTGNTDIAGGCYLFAAKRQIAGQNITLVGAILNAPTRDTAIAATPAVINSAVTGFDEVKVVKKGQRFASYSAPWGAKSDLVAAKDMSLLVWKGKDIKIQNGLESVKAPETTDQPISSVTVQSGAQTVTAPLVLANNLSGPPWHWRLLR